MANPSQPTPPEENPHHHNSVDPYGVHDNLSPDRIMAIERELQSITVDPSITSSHGSRDEIIAAVDKVLDESTHLNDLLEETTHAYGIAQYRYRTIKGSRAMLVGKMRLSEEVQTSGLTSRVDRDTYAEQLVEEARNVGRDGLPPLISLAEALDIWKGLEILWKGLREAIQNRRRLLEQAIQHGKVKIQSIPVTKMPAAIERRFVSQVNAIMAAGEEEMKNQQDG